MFKVRLSVALFTLLSMVFFAAHAWAFGFGDDKFEQEIEKEKEAVKLTREVLIGNYNIVTTAELKQMLDSGEDLLLIDTMPYEDSYKKGHIPGAKQFLFPIPEMKAWDTNETAGKSEKDFVAVLGPDTQRKIVFYCGFVKCTRSHNGALWAVRLGYTNVYRQPGGIYAWKGADYEVESEE